MIQEIVEQLAAALSLPQIEMELCPALKEGYRASYIGGVLEVEGGTPLTLGGALSLFAKGAKADHLGEYLGERSPHFPLRPVDLRGEKRPLAEVVAAGYNSVVIGEEEPSTPFEQAGIQVIREGEGESSRHWTLIKERRGGGDPNATRFEKLSHEMRHAEGKGPLIFSLGRGDAPLLNRLADHAGRQTLIAFPAEEGSYWETLRQRRNVTATPFLPILSRDGPPLEGNGRDFSCMHGSERCRDEHSTL